MEEGKEERDIVNLLLQNGHTKKEIAQNTLDLAIGADLNPDSIASALRERVKKPKTIRAVSPGLLNRLMGAEPQKKLRMVFASALMGVTFLPFINHAPYIEPIEPEEPITYIYNVEATDADNDVLTYFLRKAPDWLSIDSSTELITGIAPQVREDATYTFGVESQNKNGKERELDKLVEFYLRIKDVPADVKRLDERFEEYQPE